MTARMPPGVTLSRRGHQCRALTHKLKARSRIERPRKGERGDLAQRESRTGGRHHAALTQGDGDSQVVHEHARLRVLSLRELLLGALRHCSLVPGRTSSAIANTSAAAGDASMRSTPIAGCWAP